MEEKEKLEDYCRTVDALDSYLRKKGESHNFYKSYSRMERIIPIRKTKSLYLDTGENWNDVTDRESFNPEHSSYLNFGKCFSFSQSENVALWMLYGGVHKNGGMIDFTQKGMVSILKVSNIELGYFKNGIFEKITDVNKNSFDIYITDILYYAEEKDGMYIKRSNETCREVSTSVIASLSTNKKVLAWNYENECRLIVRIPKSIVPPKCNTVRISLDGMDLGVSLERIYRAPNFLGDGPEDTKPSRLSSTIDWDLCNGKSCCKKTPDQCSAVDKKDL